MFQQKTLEKWEKNNPSWACVCRDREISPSGSEVNQGLDKPRPWLKFWPLGWDISILDTYGGLL